MSEEKIDMAYPLFMAAMHMRKRSGGPFLSYSLDLSDADFLIEEYIIFTIGSHKCIYAFCV